jgi:hypothetical protein
MKSWIGWLAFTLVAATMLSSLAAQEYGPDRSGRPGNGPPGMGPRGRTPDPVVLEGPPSPEEFARITELPAERTREYAVRYERFMAATRVTRDSLQAQRRAMREALGRGAGEPDDQGTLDRRMAMRQGVGALRGLREELEHQQQVFDDGLKESLSKDEWKRYQNWRGERRKEAQRERREHRPPRPESR